MEEGTTRAPEVVLAVAGAAGSALGAAVAAVAGLLIGGQEAAVAAGVGALIPAVLVIASLPFLLAGGLIGRGEAVVGASLAAMGFRLGLGLVLLVVIARSTTLPFEPLGLGLVTGLIGATGAEMRRAARDPRLLAIDAAAARDRAESVAAWRREQDAAVTSANLLTPQEGPAYLPSRGGSPRRRSRVTGR